MEPLSMRMLLIFTNESWHAGRVHIIFGSQKNNKTMLACVVRTLRLIWQIDCPSGSLAFWRIKYTAQMETSGLRKWKELVKFCTRTCKVSTCINSFRNIKMWIFQYLFWWTPLLHCSHFPTIPNLAMSVLQTIQSHFLFCTQCLSSIATAPANICVGHLKF